MARQATILRLPTPPKLSNDLMAGPENARILNEHMELMTKIINQGLQSVQNRLNTIQQVGAVTPQTMSGFTVTGKQGLFYLTWNRQKNMDGYVIMQAADAQMNQLIGRYNISDGQQVSHTIPVGNVAVTNSFQIYAYQGQNYGKPSNIITATTLTYTTPEAAPGNPPIAPQHPFIAPVRSGPNLK